MSDLKITQFGNEILRSEAKKMSREKIDSPEIQGMISSMRKMLVDNKLGIGLAAPQIGVSKSIAVIELQKTPLRDALEELSLIIINPQITRTFGNRTQLWEGCISSGEGKAGLFAKVPRYKKIELKYYDERANKHAKVFEGLAAHVIQHEVDHLNGVLFVDRVADTKTYMTYSEYKKMKKRHK